jgi:tRNA threonylcarbamoyladenosine biosynthesis protein TsaB
MNVLGIETATGVCGAALAVNGVIAAVEEIDRQKIHAEKLVSLVTAVLRAGGITPRDLDGIAVSIGPGSFTGLRIGLSAAKGLAYATGVPLLAVPTLEALANRAERDGILPPEGWLCAALDARRDEVYYQRFRIEKGALRAEEPASDATVADLALLLAQHPSAPLVLTGEAREKLAGALPRQEGRAPVTLLPDPHAQCTAVTVALLGALRLSRGETEDTALLEPRYIKEFFLKPR